MTAPALTAADLRPVNLFDDLDDGELAEWAAAARLSDIPPQALLGEQGVRRPA